MPVVERQDRLGGAVLTLNSQTNRNALSRALVGELAEHLEAAAADPAVRVVALTNAGTTFCSGADLKDPPVEAGPGSFADVLQTLRDYPKPVVAALAGHVRAGGFGLVAAADVVLAVPEATFAFTEVRIGVVPAVISVLCLARMTPAAAARYMLSGERFGAGAAERAGLVSAVVADLPSALDALLGEFRQCEPHALAATRELLRTIPGMDTEAAFRHAREVSGRFFASPEAAEGIAAFRERRPPRWAS